MQHDGTARRSGRKLSLWLLTGALASLLAWRAVVSGERRAMVEEFRDHAEERATVFQWALEREATVVDHVVALFASSVHVDEDEFGAFVRRALADHPAVEEIAWARRESTRDARAGSLLVTYDEARQSPLLRAGSDLFADEAICARACTEQRLPDRLAVRWQPRGVVDDGASRLLVLAPFYAPEKAGAATTVESLRGVVALIVRVDRVYEQAIQHLTPRGIQVYLYDETAATDRDLLLHHPSRLPDGSNVPLPKPSVLASSVQYRTYVRTGGLTLRLVGVPTAGALAEPVSPQRWIVLAGGLLLTLLGARHLVMVDDQARRLETLLAQYRAVAADGALDA